MLTRHRYCLSARGAPLAAYRRTRTVAARAAQLAFSAPPTQLLQRIEAVNEDWLSNDTSRPLVFTSDSGTSCKVTLLGVVPYAPLQAEFVREIVDQAQPHVVVIDQPQHPSGEALAPYPRWIQVLVESSSHGAPLAEQLQALLHQAQVTAKIGKDIIDPFETFGFYSGTDFVQCASHIPRILATMGYLPGQEYAAAVASAQRSSAQILCIDAPLKLQEVWVSKLVKEFAVNDPSLAFQLNLAFEANAAACDPQALQWEASVGQWAVSQHDPELVMAAYKAAKAGAAALLGTGQMQAALQRSAQLQPLKFRHFAQRELHMARQLLDACMQQTDGYSVTVKRLAPEQQQQEEELGSTNGSSSGSSGSDDDTIDVMPLPPQQQQQAVSSSSSSDGGGALEAGRRRHVVAVVARHHIPGIRALWDNPGSALWQGRVTRDFSPSMVEAAGDPDVQHGGSRPVGQVPRGLDRLGELLGGGAGSKQEC